VFALLTALPAWVTGMTRRAAIEKARADGLTQKLAIESRHVTRCSRCRSIARRRQR
jgi:hypothetical protein